MCVPREQEKNFDKETDDRKVKKNGHQEKKIIKERNVYLTCGTVYVKM